MTVDVAVYRDGQRAESSADHVADELAALRSERSGAHDFLWVSLREPEPAEIDSLAQELSLHPRAVEHLKGGGQQRPAVHVVEDLALAVIKTVRFDRQTASLSTDSVTVVLAPQVALTLGRQESDVVEGSGDRQGQVFRLGPLAVLHTVLDGVLEGYAEVDEAFSDALQGVERDVFGDSGQHAHARTIYRLKREVLEFRRAIQPLQAPLLSLVDRFGAESKTLRARFRDVSARLDLILQSIDRYDALLSDALSAHLSQIGVRQNADQRKMSAWGAIILIPSLLAGIYGMNFVNMPELHWVWGYPAALAAMAVSAIVLFGLFKRSGWL